MALELVYNGYGNPIRFRVMAYAEGRREPVDFSTATWVQLYFPKDEVWAVATALGSDGFVEFGNLGSKGISKGEHAVRMVADGQVFAHEDSGDLVIKVY